MAQGSGLVTVETSVCLTSGTVMDRATAEMAVTKLDVSAGAPPLRQKVGGWGFHANAAEPGAHPVLSLDGSWLYMKEPCRGRMLGHDCNTLVENHLLPHRCSAEVPGFRVPVCYWCLPQLQYGV